MPRYSDSFKKQVLEVATHQGPTEAVRRFKVSQGSVRAWLNRPNLQRKAQASNAPDPTVLITSLRTENQKLRNLVADLLLQRTG